MAQTETKPIDKSCLEIKVSGKITAIEQINGKNSQFYASRVIIPASSPYDKPTQLQVNSKLPFGSEGDLVDITAYVRPMWRNNDGRWFFSCSLWKDKPEN